MNRNTYFTPGPSELYYSLEHYMRVAFRDKLGSISHRSQEFRDIYEETVDHIKLLFMLPEDFEVVFTSSANEIWERIIQNLVDKKSLHLVNGAFSKRFYDTALTYQKEPILHSANDSEVVSPSDLDPLDEPELIGITHNETSTGASQPLEDISSIRTMYPDALLTIDAVSSVPYPQFNWSEIDSLYFSVQKCFGLPAGLGVWIVNKKCIEKARALEDNGQVTGSYHRLSELVKRGRNFQTPETPNVLNIFLLGKIIEDMLEKELDQIRREIDYKAAVLYHTIDQLSWAKPFVKEEKNRSKTVIVAETDIDSSRIINFLEGHGLVVGGGYGKYKTDHIRIANFPTHSKEQVERLSDLLMEFH